MSFQDFSSSRQQPRSASSAQPGLGSQGASPGRPSAAYSAPQQHAAGSDPLSQASEALLQYQRNVGILENIVASMTTSSSSSISSRAKGAELLAQYEAQVDVLEHLGRKVQRLLEGGGGGGSSGGRSGTARTKLARDFERVKAQAANLQERVARFQRATAAASASAGANFSGAASSSSSGPDHYHQQVQLQLQQDRLAEEIMREREEEIRNINRGMHQVNEIYKDLAHIVGTQQEGIDTIETQMEESRANAESGLRQVEKANEKYGSSNCTVS